MVRHLAILFLLATLGACSSLTPAGNPPAPVESVGNTTTTATPDTGPTIDTGSGPADAAMRRPSPDTGESDTWAASPVGQQVSAALRERNFVKAGALIERELGISPRDAFLWLQLSTVRMLENRLEEAQGMAQRALSLSRSKSMQDAANDQLGRIQSVRP